MIWNATDCPVCGGAGVVNRSRRAVEVAESFADGLATWEEFSAAHDGARWAEDDGPRDAKLMALVVCGTGAAGVAGRFARELTVFVPPAVQADLLRCVFGSPWRPVTFKIVEPDKWVCGGCGVVRVPVLTAGESFGPCECGAWNWRQWDERDEWLTTAAVAFAKDVYDGRRFEDAPVLADMLEADGCPIDKPCGRCSGKKIVLGESRGERKDAGYLFGNNPCPDCKATGRVPNRLLAHLRSGGPHCRGCWATDLILGRS